jgi:UDP-N-acetylmuramate-alanine ligase
MIEQLRIRGKQAYQFNRAADIAQHYAEFSRPNDVFCVMSNGSFGGLVSKVVGELKEIRTHE